MSTASYFEYDPTSPSCLVWHISAQDRSTGKGRGERHPGTSAGSFNNGVWHIHVTEEDIRTRTTAHRIVWELHHGPAPEGSVILHKHGHSNDIENLICVSKQEHNWVKAWKNSVSNIRQSPSGRYYTTIRGYKSLGTYDTYDQASTIYRTTLQQLLLTRGIDLWNN